MEGKAALAGLNGLLNGITEGLKMRQDRDSKEKELALQQQKQEQELAFKTMEMEMKMADGASKRDYYKSMAEIAKEKNDIAASSLGVKLTDKNTDNTTKVTSEITKINDKLLEQQEKYNEIKNSRRLAKNPEEQQRQLAEMEESIFSLKDTRDKLSSRLSSGKGPRAASGGKKVLKGSAQFQKVMTFLESNSGLSLDQIDQEIDDDYKQMTPDERKQVRDIVKGLKK